MESSQWSWCSWPWWSWWRRPGGFPGLPDPRPRPDLHLIFPRKFYATRATFISQAVSKPGITLKWLAEYCGTSVEMIERHYGRYMHGDASQLALLAAAIGDSAEEEPRGAAGSHDGSATLGEP